MEHVFVIEDLGMLCMVCNTMYTLTALYKPGAGYVPPSKEGCHGRADRPGDIGEMEARRHVVLSTGKTLCGLRLRVSALRAKYAPTVDPECVKCEREVAKMMFE